MRRAGAQTRRRAVVTGLVVLLVCASARLQAQQRSEFAAESFTVQAIMSAPFADALVASPNGRAIAWLGDEEGKRNVWVAEAPSWRARRLTRYLQDDGQELSDLVWTADSRSLLYTRGGDRGSNWDLTVPVNPTGDARGTDQAVWIIPLAGGAPRRIGDGHAASPSPRGDVVVWILRDTLRTAPLARAGAPAVLLRMRGESDLPTWSPDGKRLAFVSRRGDHSFIGVVDMPVKTVRWMAPGTWQDDSPSWSPDGTKLAFVREPGSPYPTGPSLPAVKDSSYASATIEVADPVTGIARAAWHAGSQGGGFSDAFGLQWVQGDRILFGSELTGWLGLYVVSAQGGPAARITPTNCEVETIGLARDRGSVLFASNCGDIDRRHVQRVSVDGGAPTPVTTGTGLEWIPQELADGRVAVLRSDARHPAAPAVADSSGITALTGWTLPDAFPTDQLVEPQQVVYRTSDSMEIHGQLFMPADSVRGRRPAVIFFHGGPSRQMMLAWHNRSYYHNSYAFNQYLASRGFIVLSVNYRGGIGYGRAFRTAPRRGRFGGSEYADVLASAAWLRARPDVDSAHIGLWGGSYGGYLTSLGLARNSDLFAAGFDLHGVHDYAEESNITRQFGVSDSAIAIARRSSAIGSVATWKSPVLMVAGDDDRNVQFRQTVDLAVRLRRLGVRVDELIFVDDTHHFLKHANWVAAYRAGAGFFAETLR